MSSNIWLAVAVTVITSSGLLFATVVALSTPGLLTAYSKDLAFSFVNGLVGATGICLYILNIPIYSRIGSFDIFSAQYTFLYVICNTMRFICWYLEFMTTFLLLTLLKYKGITLTLLRYSFHTINLLFSVACFSICVLPSFPSRSLPGYNIIPPEVWQSVLMHYVFASYYFIIKSQVHQFDARSLFLTYSTCVERVRFPCPPPVRR